MVDGVSREDSYQRLAPLGSGAAGDEASPQRQSYVLVNSTSTLNFEPDDIDKEYDFDDTENGSFCAACRHHVKLTLDGPKHGWVASCIQCMIISCILFSTLCTIMETIPEVDHKFKRTFIWLENAFTLIFTVEIVVRVWVADKPCVYFLSGSNLVDMLAVMPWYIEFLACHLILAAQNSFNENEIDSFESLRMVRIVRMIRLARVARLAKAARHSETITTMIQSVNSSASGLFSLVACICMGTVFSATVIYWLECEEPETQFTSIPASIWWALPTITGVGYGDMVPMTVPGRMAASVCMVAGTLITSLCVAILTNSFIEQFNRNQQLLKVEKANSNKVAKKKGKRFLNSASNSSIFDDFVSSRQSNEPLQRGSTAVLDRVESGDSSNLMGNLHALEDKVTNLMMELQGRDKNKDSTYNPSMEILEEHRKMFFKHLAKAVEQVVEDEEVIQTSASMRPIASASMQRSSSMKNAQRASQDLEVTQYNSEMAVR